MKKLISVVAAAAVTMSTFSLLASAAFYEDSFDGELNSYNVPAVDYVPVGLSIGLSWDDANDYRASISKPYSSTTPTDTTFDARAELNMENVAKEWNAILDTASNEDDARRTAAINNARLSGEFTITIEDTGTTKGIVNDKVTSSDSSVLEWIENNAGKKVTDFFEFKSMEKVGNQYVIKMGLKNDNGINTDLDEYFKALTTEGADINDYKLLLQIQDSNVPAAAATYRVTGTFSGYVDIKLGNNTVSTIWFGKGETVEETVEGSVEKTVKNVPVEASATVSFYRASRGGGGGGGGSVTSNATPAPTEAPEATTAPVEGPTATPVANPQQGGLSSGAQLNYDDHFAYIIGYNLEDGETLAQVRPNANITRAEVATIFFRLLTDESRAKLWTKTNSFSDVPAAEWYNNAISTDAKAGIMEGSDGRFRPNAPITRAEFATIASRFSSVTYTGADKFSDVAGHWAAEYINKAAETGWINGYDDGTFRPNANITRAEAMTLINRMVYRLVDKNSFIEAGMNKWSDNLDTNAWYYADVQEATNSHDYERTAVGYVEKWTATKAPRDWEALEKTWSEAASAGAEESVFTDSGLEELNTENTK